MKSHSKNAKEKVAVDSNGSPTRTNKKENLKITGNELDHEPKNNTEAAGNTL